MLSNNAKPINLYNSNSVNSKPKPYNKSLISDYTLFLSLNSINLKNSLFSHPPFLTTKVSHTMKITFLNFNKVWFCSKKIWTFTKNKNMILTFHPSSKNQNLISFKEIDLMHPLSVDSLYFLSKRNHKQ